MRDPRKAENDIVKKEKHTSQPIVQGSLIPLQNQQCQRNHQSLL